MKLNITSTTSIHSLILLKIALGPYSWKEKTSDILKKKKKKSTKSLYYSSSLLHAKEDIGAKGTKQLLKPTEGKVKFSTVSPDLNLIFLPLKLREKQCICLSVLRTPAICYIAMLLVTGEPKCLFISSEILHTICHSQNVNWA